MAHAETLRILDGEQVLVRRSKRRRKTVSAFREHGAIVVAIPSAFSRADEDWWVRRMLARLAASDQRRTPDGDALTARALTLSKRYLDDQATPTAVSWVSNQAARWGSCTPATGTIRISDRAQGMPDWVLDYILLHELAHLIEPSHGTQFWALVERYPMTERARGFLLGIDHAAQQ